MIGVFAGNKTSDNTADNMPDNTELDATITSISCTATKYDIKIRMGQNEFWERYRENGRKIFIQFDERKIEKSYKIREQALEQQNELESEKGMSKF